MKLFLDWETVIYNHTERCEKCACCSPCMITSFRTVAVRDKRGGYFEWHTIHQREPRNSAWVGANALAKESILVEREPDDCSEQYTLRTEGCVLSKGLWLVVEVINITKSEFWIRVSCFSSLLAHYPGGSGDRLKVAINTPSFIFESIYFFIHWYIFTNYVLLKHIYVY